MSGDDKRAAEQSRAIDKELAQAKKKATKEVKLLLLGAGASGKSTVAKQMHILYLNGFGESELIEYKQQVATNMVNNMRALLLGARKLGTGPSACFHIRFLLISFSLANQLRLPSQSGLFAVDVNAQIFLIDQFYESLRKIVINIDH
jgi:energy-coupling factor transporter ATP-binding protein EcfA2